MKLATYLEGIIKKEHFQIINITEFKYLINKLSNSKDIPIIHRWTTDLIRNYSSYKNNENKRLDLLSLQGQSILHFLNKTSNDIFLSSATIQFINIFFSIQIINKDTVKYYQTIYRYFEISDFHKTEHGAVLDINKQFKQAVNEVNQLNQVQSLKSDFSNFESPISNEIMNLNEGQILSKKVTEAYDAKTIGASIAKRISKINYKLTTNNHVKFDYKNNSEVFVFFPEEIIPDLNSSQKFLNQYQTNKGSYSGIYSPRERRETEYYLAGFSLDKNFRDIRLDPSFIPTDEIRPIYGLMQTNTNKPSARFLIPDIGYGKVAAVLNNIPKQRTTWTTGDSLAIMWKFVDSNISMNDYRGSMVDNYLPTNPNYVQHNYFEAQVWGGLDISEVKYFLIDSTEESITKLKKIGLPIYEMKMSDKHGIKGKLIYPGNSVKLNKLSKKRIRDQQNFQKPKKMINFDFEIMDINAGRVLEVDDLISIPNIKDKFQIISKYDHIENNPSQKRRNDGICITHKIIGKDGVKYLFRIPETKNLRSLDRISNEIKMIKILQQLRIKQNKVIDKGSDYILKEDINAINMKEWLLNWQVNDFPMADIGLIKLKVLLSQLNKNGYYLKGQNLKDILWTGDSWVLSDALLVTSKYNDKLEPSTAIWHQKGLISELSSHLDWERSFDKDIIKEFLFSK